MFKIGNIQINGKVALAPMAGYTSIGYRNFMNPFGISFCFTEMVSDMGLIYGNKETYSYINFPKSDVPTGIQLFGSDPENLAKALLICEKFNPNVDFYNVNMACPVNKVTKTGAGSALMKDPKKCGDIIRALKQVTNKPITAKIRLGWDNNSINYFEVIQEMEKAGVDMIAIHARTTKELYTGFPHYELIKDLRNKMRCPLVVSGNIFTPEDAVYALKITGAEAVMVARGGIGNPLLISNINNLIDNREIITPTLLDQTKYCKELAKELIDEKGEDVAMRIYRSMSSHFFTSFPDSKKMRSRLSSEVVTFNQLNALIDEYINDIKEKINF